jgi:hypothetical protein
MEQSPDDA